LSVFIAIELVVERPAVDLRLLALRNFGLGTAANIIVGFALFGSIYLLPTYLSEVQGYDAEQTGFVLAWAGVPQLFIIPLVPVLQRYFDQRAIVCVGLVIFGASCFLNIHLSFNDGGEQFRNTNIVRAVGQAISIAPLAAIAMAGIPKEKSGAASGLFNMMRSLGGAIGTAILATIISKREQFHSNIIGQAVTPYDNNVAQFLANEGRYFLAHGAGDATSAKHQAEILVGHLIKEQSLILAVSDSFFVIGVMVSAAAIFVVLTRAGQSMPSTKSMRRP
jgi:DHA2 family multidrug resistance protein